MIQFFKVQFNYLTNRNKKWAMKLPYNFFVSDTFFWIPWHILFFNYILRLTQGEYVKTLLNNVTRESEVLILKNTTFHSCPEVDLSIDTVPLSCKNKKKSSYVNLNSFLDNQMWKLLKDTVPFHLVKEYSILCWKVLQQQLTVVSLMSVEQQIFATSNICS